MFFKYSNDFDIDTEQEPWVREGLRVGVYGAPGSTKSYTAAAFIIEQFLRQDGTVIIFQPRAEWHTLKDKFPDVQVVGGPYNQDVPFSPSHPKLYAEAVVEQGISMIFYTPEVDDEEKLINFVDRFLDYVMKMQEVKHRPLLIVLEEAHEYAPRTPSGHVAPAWVFNRMVKKCKDVWTGGRKLNIVPLAITQRPQDLHFAIRQLCNLTLYGQFSPQDISYIDKECLSHYRKEGLDIKAGGLLNLSPGKFLIIHHGEAEYKDRTVERTTPHGADTPSLEFVPDSSEEVRTTISSLGETLKELLEQQAAEESEMQKTKRKNRDLEKQVDVLDGKVKLGVDLKELLKGGQADPKLVEENQRLNEQLVLLKKDYDNASHDNREYQKTLEVTSKNVNSLSVRVANLRKYEKFAGVVDTLKSALNIDNIEFKLLELIGMVRDLKKGVVVAAGPPAADEEAVGVVQTRRVIEVEKRVKKVDANTDTAEGMLIYLIGKKETLLDWMMASEIASELRMRGRSISDKNIYAPLDRLVTYGLLSKMKQGKGQVYKVAKDAFEWVEIR